MKWLLEKCGKPTLNRIGLGKGVCGLPPYNFNCGWAEFRCSEGCQAELPPASVTVLSRVSSVDLSLPHSGQTVLHYDGIH